MHPDALEFLRWCDPDVLVARVACPLGRHWAVADLIHGEVECYRHGELRRWPLRVVMMRRRQQSELDLYRYYPDGVVPCPSCGAALELDDTQHRATCGCGGTWSYAALVDRAADKLMREPPRYRRAGR